MNNYDEKESIRSFTENENNFSEQIMYIRFTNTNQVTIFILKMNEDIDC
jgi:hypothetical protein